MSAHWMFSHVVVYAGPSAELLVFFAAAVALLLGILGVR